MKNISLVICDIDGTLVNKGEKLLTKTKKALIDIHNKGILLGLATGRPIDNRIIDKTKEWGLDFNVDVLMGCNGCELWYQNENIIHKYDYLDKDIVKYILDFIWPLDVNAIIFEDGYNHVVAKFLNEQLERSIKRNNSNVEYGDKERLSGHDVAKLEIHYDEIIEEELLNLIKEKQRDDFSYIKTFTGTIEFQKPGVNKGKGLERICQDMNISLDNVIACGDMDNDASMIKKAGIGICLANGSDYAKSVATYITEYDVSDDGLGIFFEDFLNK